MPVPWEAMLPMGIVVVMFGVTGSGFRLVKQLTNDGKVSPVFVFHQIYSDQCDDCTGALGIVSCRWATLNWTTLLFIRPHYLGPGSSNVHFPIHIMLIIDPLFIDTVQPSRYALDNWETMMMQRDERLTGSLRGQSVSCILHCAGSQRTLLSTTDNFPLDLLTAHQQPLARRIHKRRQITLPRASGRQKKSRSKRALGRVSLLLLPVDSSQQ